MSGKTSPSQARDLRASILHLSLYSVLLLVYFFLVLRYLSGWLNDLFHYHRHEYALLAIALMIVQAVGLESVSYSILQRIRRKP